MWFGLLLDGTDYLGLVPGFIITALLKLISVFYINSLTMNYI